MFNIGNLWSNGSSRDEGMRPPQDAEAPLEPDASEYDPSWLAREPGSMEENSGSHASNSPEGGLFNDTIYPSIETDEPLADNSNPASNGEALSFTSNWETSNCPGNGEASSPPDIRDLSASTRSIGSTDSEKANKEPTSRREHLPFGERDKLPEMAQVYAQYDNDMEKTRERVVGMFAPLPTPPPPVEPKGYWPGEEGPVSREHFNEYKEYMKEGESKTRLFFIQAGAEGFKWQGLAENLQKELIETKQELEQVMGKLELTNTSLGTAWGDEHGAPLEDNSLDNDVEISQRVSSGHPDTSTLAYSGPAVSLPPIQTSHSRTRGDPTEKVYNPNYTCSTSPLFVDSPSSTTKLPHLLAPVSVQPGAKAFLYDNVVDQQSEILIEVLLLQAKLHIASREFAEVRNKAQQAEGMALKLKYGPLVARCRYYLAVASFEEGDYEACRALSGEALECRGRYKEGEWVGGLFERAGTAVDEKKVREGKGARIE